MKNPLATYRLQFHSQFQFEDARKIINYLSDLGISDIYASPIFKAKKDSPHGYDIVDPTEINPQLGGKQGFEDLIKELQPKGLGWIQDIVPNHMAFDSDNRLLMDIVEKGPLSKFYNYFDINWDHPYEHLRGKVLAPFLGDLYGTCLDKNEIKLNFDKDGFNIRFYDFKFPLRIESYAKILSDNLLWLEQNMAHEDELYIQLLEIINSLKRFFDVAPPEDRDDQIALIKAHLWKSYTSDSTIKEYIDSSVNAFNGIPGDSHSLDRLDDLLSRQVFRLSFWKVGNEELNYRRFFTINGLVSLRVENKKVFDYTHDFIFQLIKSGAITGLRIDHLDGLYDPLGYLAQLRQRGEEVYIVIEKILDLNENLPPVMPVQGTTGYDFLNEVNGIFIDQQNERVLDKIYSGFTGLYSSYRPLVCEKKKHFMGKYMAGDIDNLAHLLKQILNRNRYGKDMTMYALRRAIVEIMSQFPVYRSYMSEEKTDSDNKIYIKEAVALAQNRNSDLIHELEFIGRILLSDFGREINTDEKQEYFHFAQKFQQFSGALMAKGAEDTTFYVYNRFLSLNEVGGDPSILGISIQNFHEFMLQRQKLWPQTMNATSTHDTKRGEDIRARLNVLSEVPREWEKQVRIWNKRNKKYKKMIPGLKVRAPVRNDEYFIYQTLVGSYPFNGEGHELFRERLKQYILKVLREAQVHTGWINPNHNYEEVCLSFIDSILSKNEQNDFLDSFIPFQKKISSLGIYNSLAQVLLKLTCPGTPDFYQGTELWDFSFVDPDNRRPVDYQHRILWLGEIRQQEGNKSYFQNLVNGKEDGKIKLFLIFKGLQLRKEKPDLFLKGDYIPLTIQGSLERHVIAFARKWNEDWAITVVGRFLNDNLIHGQWAETNLILPQGICKCWKNVLTGEMREIKDQIPLNDLLKDFPLALLTF
jgi:(1->4)-alpha-D-glucan 1-alpha-D-glucosylmutase